MFMSNSTSWRRSSAAIHPVAVLSALNRIREGPSKYDAEAGLYAYVANDPVNAVDSDGQQMETFMFIDFDVSRAATRDSDDPNAGPRAVAE